MVIELSNLWIAIGAKTSGLASGVAEAGRIIGTFAANTKVQIAKINAAWAGFENVKGLAGLTLGLTLLGTALALSIGPAIAFESAFANVAKTFRGTPEQLGQVRSEILAMADSMPLAATEIAEVAATAGQLGVAAQDVTEFTRVMVMLGTATNLTADQAATSMARFTNIMQIPIQELPLLAAALVHLGNNSAATESEILTLGLRLAAAGSQLGLSGQQVLALSAAMKSLGITAEVGGSAMSRVLIDMVTASGPKLEAFARLVGVTNEEFTTLVKSRSPEAAGKLILGFVDGLQKVDERGGSVRKVLQDLGLDSIRLRDVIFRLVGGGDQLAQSFALVGDKAVYGGALLAEYGRFAETTASRLEILKNRLVGLAIDIGTPLLGGIAAAADGIGDAVLALQGALGPLAAALAETFGNGAKIIGVFASTLGPTLSGAVATLGALAQIVGSLIGVFNGLGPAGLVVAALAADLYLVGPASVAAAAGLAAFKAAAVEVGVASALARGGMAALSAALPMAPVAVAVAGLYLLGKAMQDAKSRAQELSQELSLNLARSLETGDWNAFASQVSSTQTRIKELNSELRGSDLSWDTIKKGARAVFEVLPFVDNQLLNTAAEMKGLQGVLDDPNFGDNFRSNVAALAYDMGISSEAAFGLIVATNNLSQAQVGGVESYEKIQAAAENYIAELTGMTGASEEAVTGMLEEGLTVERLAQAYGVSMDTIKQAMAEAKLTEEDLFDPKKYDEVVEALSGVIGPWERLGEAAGLTADQIAAADAQTKLLIASQKELADSFDKVKAARAAAEFPIENLRQATEAYAKATEEYKNGKITLEQYGQALLGLNSAQAAVAPTVNAALDAQAKNAAAFRETALKAGETEQAITDVLVSWGLLSRAEAAELKVKGGDVLDLARRRILDLREQLRDKFIAEMAVERGTTEADIERLLARGDEWATSVFEAKMDAATEAPFREIADLMVQAGVWDALEAEAFLSADPATAFAIIESAFGKMETWKGPWIGIMTADNSDVEAREGASRALLQGFVDTEWKGYLTADNSDVQARESESRVTLTSFRDEKWQAMLTADNTDALSKASQASDENNRYKDAQYQARLTSDNTDALSKKSQASDENNRYAQAKYEARLTSNNSDSLSKSKQASDEANRYGALRPNAVLSATDNASGVIQGAIDRLKGFQSKSITITATTINQSVGASATSNRIGNNAFPAANGMILRSFASGGFENHVAQIARGSWPARLWAEPETGGEAYIPLAQAKRRRSTAILNTVASDFGYQLVPMASGGIMRDQAAMAAVMAAAGWRSLGPTRYARDGTINISAPISIRFDGASGLDANEVGRIVQDGVRKAFTNVDRRLANARR